jgi:glycine amidinotransferase
MITIGNTILEAPMSHRSRYFESYSYRDIIYQLYNNDKRVLWKTAPKPSMKNNMFDLNVWHGLEEEEIANVFNNEGWRTGLLEKEMAFDAADIMRFGKDMFLRKSASANNMALDWLRREFPDMRVHLFHCLDAYERHADCELVPLCPPTAGKEGLVMTHYKYPILDAETKIFKDNDWRVVCVPPP